MVGEIAGFLIIFFAVLILSAGWTDRALGDEESRLSAMIGFWAQSWVCCEAPWWWRLCSPSWPLLRPRDVLTVAVGSVFPGRRKGCNLARTFGIAPRFTRVTWFMAGADKSSGAGPGEVASVQ